MAFQITEVLDVIEFGRVYKLGNTRCNKQFKLRFGNSEKNFRFEFISTQDFTEEEFGKWKDECEKANIALPTMEDIEKKEKEIREANNYQFKESDVDHVSFSCLGGVIYPVRVTLLKADRLAFVFSKFWNLN